jgi:hypothetical protein
MFAIGSGNDFGGESEVSVSKSDRPVGADTIELLGLPIGGLPRFTVQVKSAKAGAGDTSPPVAVWGKRGVTPLKLKEAVVKELRHSSTGRLPNTVEEGSEVLLVQFEMTSSPQRFELVFQTGPPEAVAELTSETPVVKPLLSTLEASAARRFDADFLDKYKLADVCPCLFACNVSLEWSFQSVDHINCGIAPRVCHP